MWSTKNGKVVLDISKIRSDFRVVSQDGLNLVCPKKNMWDWSDEEKWLRSVVVDDNGLVVSCAWKKFGNYGEFSTDTSVLDWALKHKKPVLFTHKEDGSLCIRSVMNNRVVMRTRGTLYGGYAEEGEETFAERFQKVAANKYPAVLDPSMFQDRSLLFEYVSPTNRIVINYKEDDLVFIGAIIHGNLRICSWAELELIASSFDLNLVKVHELPTSSVEIIHAVNEWDDEGVVTRCNFSPVPFGPKAEIIKDQVLVKIKSAKYLAKHRMKFSMSYKFMVEFVELSTIVGEAELVKKLRDCDYDWETIDAAKQFYERYRAACKLTDDAMKIARRLHSEFLADALPEWAGGGDLVKQRKEYAQIACAQGGLIRPMMFALYDGKVDRLNALRKKIILTEGKRRK
jgi:hypothetical protein